MSTEKQFVYLLNAMEYAAQQEKPAEHGYAAKRQAVLAFVRSALSEIEELRTELSDWKGSAISRAECIVELRGEVARLAASTPSASKKDDDT